MGLYDMNAVSLGRDLSLSVKLFCFGCFFPFLFVWLLKVSVTCRVKFRDVSAQTHTCFWSTDLCQILFDDRDHRLVTEGSA